MLPFALATGYEWIALYEPMQPARLWRRRIDGFVVHGAALAHEGIAFAEAGNSRTGTLPMLRGLDWSGAELWTWSPPAGEAVHEVTWNRETESWAAVLRPYVERGTSVLLSVSRDGELMDAVEIGQVFCAAFVAGGRQIVVARSDGERVVTGHVLEVPSGKEVWAFHRGKTVRPDP